MSEDSTLQKANNKAEASAPEQPSLRELMARFAAEPDGTLKFSRLVEATGISLSNLKVAYLNDTYTARTASIIHESLKNALELPMSPGARAALDFIEQNPPVQPRLGKRLGKLLNDAGHVYFHFSASCGFSDKYISGVVNGHVIPSAERLQIIAAKLGVDPSKIDTRLLPLDVDTHEAVPDGSNASRDASIDIIADVGTPAAPHEDNPIIEDLADAHFDDIPESLCKDIRSNPCPISDWEDDERHSDHKEQPCVASPDVGKLLSQLFGKNVMELHAALETTTNLLLGQIEETVALKDLAKRQSAELREVMDCFIERSCDIDRTIGENAKYQSTLVMHENESKGLMKMTKRRKSFENISISLVALALLAILAFSIGANYGDRRANERLEKRLESVQENAYGKTAIIEVVPSRSHIDI